MFNTVWYDNLIKPFSTPPPSVFAPVWIILYGTIFLSVILYAVRLTKKEKQSGYIIFAVHMIFNLLWSPVFFLLQKIDIALFVICIIDLTAILFIKKFYSVAKISGIILIPYLVWLGFATYLNIQFLRLN